MQLQEVGLNLMLALLLQTLLFQTTAARCSVSGELALLSCWLLAAGLLAESAAGSHARSAVACSVA